MCLMSIKVQNNPADDHFVGMAMMTLPPSFFWDVHSIILLKSFQFLCKHSWMEFHNIRIIILVNVQTKLRLILSGILQKIACNYEVSDGAAFIANEWAERWDASITAVVLFYASYSMLSCLFPFVTTRLENLLMIWYVTETDDP